MRSELFFFFVRSFVRSFIFSFLLSQPYRGQLHPCAQRGSGDPGGPQQAQDPLVAPAAARDERPDVDAALCRDGPGHLGITELLAVRVFERRSGGLEPGRDGVAGARVEVVGRGEAGGVARGRWRGKEGRELGEDKGAGEGGGEKCEEGEGCCDS